MGMGLGMGMESTAPIYPSPAARTPLSPTGILTKGQALDTLKQELAEDLEMVLDKNMVVFMRKLDVQKRQLILELSVIFKTQSDRVITAVDSGPHDRVIDSVRSLISTTGTPQLTYS
jgi:hypothetical protein